MIIHSEDALICECGHTGLLHLKDEDPRYGSRWEHYDLEVFDGGRLTVSIKTARPRNLLAEMNPKCPECGQLNKVRYAYDAG